MLAFLRNTIRRAAALVVVGCSAGSTDTTPTTPTTPSTPATTKSLAKVAGDNQLGVSSAALVVAPSVKVTASNGQAVAGVAVTFAVATGGGSVTAGTQTTDASGVATVGRWTLGPTGGNNTLAASATGVTGSPATFTATGTSAADQRGIYVYSEKLAQDAQSLAQALTVPGVDGITLLLGWMSLEPSLGNYNFATLDLWMSAAISSGKKVVLAVRAGQDTPCWLFRAPGCGAAYAKPYAGATPLAFEVSARQGIGQSQCLADTIAAPWDPVFLTEWDNLLGAVAAHLKSAGSYGAITAVRLTGVNRSTAELRLPEEILTTPCAGNAIVTWLQAAVPYRPARALQAWDAVTNSFQKSFPDKFFGLEIVPDSTGNNSFPFPEIDDNGCIYTAIIAASSAPAACKDAGPMPDQNAPLLTLANQKFSGRLAVAFQNLDIRFPADQHVVAAAQTLGTKIGYQVNDYNNLQQSACGGTSLVPVPCTAALYLALLEVGIYPLGKSNSLRAQYIEVLPPDAVAYPSAVLQAHAELVGTAAGQRFTESAAQHPMEPAVRRAKRLVPR